MLQIVAGKCCNAQITLKCELFNRIIRLYNNSLHIRIYAKVCSAYKDTMA